MTVLVKDTFTDTNGVNLSSHIADTGQSWTSLSTQSILINNNSAYSNGSGQGMYVLDTGASDGTLSLTISNSTGAGEYDVFFRVTDSKNYYIVKQISSTVYLEKYINGSGSIIVQKTRTAPASGDTLSITFNGNSISVNFNGANLITATDTSYPTQTKVGIGFYNSSTYAFDNFEVDSIASSGTTYIGSGLSQGTSSASSNETLILSSSGQSNGQSSLNTNESVSYSAGGQSSGQSSLTTNETVISNTGTTYSASGQSTGQSSLTTSETVSYTTSGTSQGRSSLLSEEKIIALASGQSQGKSSLTTNETVIGHATTVYNTSGTSQGKSSLTTNERMIYSAGGVSEGKTNLSTHETVVFVVSGNSNGQTTIITHETYQSKEQIIRHITLQGSRQLHITLQGSRQLHIILKGGVDMAVNNSTEDIYQGQSAIIDIPNITDDNNTLNLSSCTSITFKAKRGINLISKDLTNGVTAVDATTLKITLEPSDTNVPPGLYPYQIWCTDDQGEPTPLSIGTLNVIPSMVTQ